MAAVSIIIPVYNGIGYIKNALGDIGSQTFSDYELILVDDGSDDGTAELLKEYRNKDHRIVLIEQKHLGAGAARNAGIDAATGKYLLFLDSDDRFDKNLVEHAYYAAEENQTDILIFDGNVVDDEIGETINYSFLIDKDYIPAGSVFSYREYGDWLLDSCYHTVWFKLYSREFINRTGIRFKNTPYMNDEFFHDITLAEAERILFLDEKLITYHWKRKNSITMSSAYMRNPGVAVDNLRDVRSYLQKNGKYSLFEKGFLATSVGHTLVSLQELYTDAGIFYDTFEKYKEFLINELHADKLFEESRFNDWRKNRLEMMSRCTGAEYIFDVFVYYREHTKYIEQENRRSSHEIEELTKARDELLFLMKYKRWTLNYHEFEKGDRVIIYGAGDVGTDFVNQVQRDGVLSLIAWVDMNYQNATSKKVVESPEIIREKDFDCLIVAIRDARVAKEVKNKWKEIVPDKRILIMEEVIL